MKGGVKMDKEKLKELGNAILVLRAKRQFTIEELSRKSNVAYTTLSFIENAKSERPRVSTIYKIALALGVEPKELLQYLD